VTDDIAVKLAQLEERLKALDEKVDRNDAASHRESIGTAKEVERRFMELDAHLDRLENDWKEGHEAVRGQIVALAAEFASLRTRMWLVYPAVGAAVAAIVAVMVKVLFHV
jgi:DNA repair exonuclease SbcCD ATPase subunit